MMLHGGVAPPGNRAHPTALAPGEGRAEEEAFSTETAEGFVRHNARA